MKKVIFILLLVAVGFFLWQRGTVSSYEFSGQIEKIEGNLIYARGLTADSDKPESYHAERIRSVVASVDNDTVFEREVWHMLTAEELKKSDGKWELSQLRKETQEGSLSDLDAGSSVTIESRNNIYNKTEFRAKKVKYVKQVYPDLPE